MINRDRLVKTFCDLASIDSPSSEEEAIAAELARRLEKLGLAVIRDDYGNIIASDGDESPIMLSAHMDTVEPGRGIKPRIEGNRIVSDESTIVAGDCKAGIAAILEALESIREDGVPRLAVEVILTREEEPGLIGARNLDYTKMKAKEGVILDTDGPVSEVISTAPSRIDFDIRITGRAAHAGIGPERGLSAIRVAAELICRLPQGRLDQETTFNVATMEAGTVRNAVPAAAALKGEFRSYNMNMLKSVRRRLNEAIDQVRRMFPEASIEDDVRTEFDTYTLTDDDPAIQRATAALRSLGLEPKMKTSGGGSDANIFRHQGIKAVVVGMGTYDLHSVQESVIIPELVDAARFCEALLRT